MKNQKVFTPPRKMSHNSTSGRHFRKILLCLSLAMSLSATACAQASNDTEPESSTEAPTSDSFSFNGYDWGTSYEEIFTAEITDDMMEGIHYDVEEMDEMTGISIYGQQAAGYDTSVGYAFADDALIAGYYDMGGVDSEIYDDLYEKLTSEYDTPSIEKESTGWGRCSVWVDDSHNVICLSEILDLIYMEYDSVYWEFINDQFIEFHELDLKEEVDKIGNTDGL